MTTTIAVFNNKGGVGKTACAVNLAYSSALAGRSVLLWDLDPQGAASFYFRIEPRLKGLAKRLSKHKGGLDERIKGSDYPGLDMLPADAALNRADLLLQQHKKSEHGLHRALKPLLDDYDVVVLDCPPSLSLLAENIVRAADVLLVPTVPTPLALRTLKQIDDFIQAIAPESKRMLRRLAFVSMFEPRKTLQRELAAKLLAQPGVLQTMIPYASVVERMGLARAPIAAYAPSSGAAKAFAKLWLELLEAID